MSVRAECTWGEGPDVLVVVERANVSGYNWTPYDPEITVLGAKDAGSFGLTINEALALAAQLVQSAVAATRLDAGYMEAGRPLEVCADPIVTAELVPSEMPEAAVSLISQPETGKVLVVWNRRFNGWTLPGGKREPGETIEQTQARELDEEVGLETVRAELLYDSFDDVLQRHVYIYLVETRGTPQEMEHGCPFMWMDRETLTTSPAVPFRAIYKRMFDKGLMKG